MKKKKLPSDSNAIMLGQPGFGPTAGFTVSSHKLVVILALHVVSGYLQRTTRVQYCALLLIEGANHPEPDVLLEKVGLSIAEVHYMLAL